MNTNFLAEKFLRARQVTDTGKGIADEFLPHVFEPFRQAKSVTTRTHGGLGLGLAIVKYLVEAHSGNISASSAGEGQGATFVVEIPVRAVSPGGAVHAHRKFAAAGRQSEAEKEFPSLRGLSILFVDDHPDARTLVATVLGNCGADVVVAESVAEGFRKLSERSFDVLVSDIGMPAKTDIS